MISLQSRGSKCCHGLRKAQAENLALPSQILFHRSGQLRILWERCLQYSGFFYAPRISENTFSHHFIHAIPQFPQFTIHEILLGFVSSVCLRKDSIHVLLTFSTGGLNLYAFSGANNDIYRTYKVEKVKKKRYKRWGKFTNFVTGLLLVWHSCLFPLPLCRISWTNARAHPGFGQHWSPLKNICLVSRDPGNVKTLSQTPARVNFDFTA